MQRPAPANPPDSMSSRRSSSPIARVQRPRTRGTRDRRDRRAWHVAQSLMPVGSSRGRSRRSSTVAPLHLRHLPPARSPILSQRAGLSRRPDPEVPVVRRAPLGDDRPDLDELVPTGEAPRRLVTSMPRVAVDGNREDGVTHRPSRDFHFTRFSIDIVTARYDRLSP